MNRKGNFVRRLLFKFLPFEYYLKGLSKLYFISFEMGLLKKNRLYDYPYFLDKVISTADVCIDIGANLGYITVRLAKLTGNSGKVYAVEPVKPILNVLKSNTKNLKNVEIYPFALGTRNAAVKLGNNTKKQKGFIASGSNFILDKNFTPNNIAEVEFDAEMRKGSELFYNLDKLDFIKVDIEGYESIVIPELEPIILKFYPIFLIEACGQSRIEMLDFFESRKYSAFVLYEGKLYPAKKDECFDILFIPQSKLGKFSKYISELSPKASHSEAPG